MSYDRFRKLLFTGLGGSTLLLVAIGASAH